jgi:hypothetical protein
VLSVDEKPQVQALVRSQPAFPMTRADSHRDLGQRGVEDADVVGGGVRPRVARTELGGEELAGVVQVGQQRVVAEGVLERRRSVSSRSGRPARPRPGRSPARPDRQCRRPSSGRTPGRWSRRAGPTPPPELAPAPPPPPSAGVRRGRRAAASMWSPRPSARTTPAGRPAPRYRRWFPRRRRWRPRDRPARGPGRAVAAVPVRRPEPRSAPRSTSSRRPSRPAARCRRATRPRLRPRSP